MLLVGRESVPENTGFELLTFECECGTIATSVVDEKSPRLSGA